MFCPGTSLPIRGDRQTKRPRRALVAPAPAFSTEEHAFDATLNGSCLLLFCVGAWRALLRRFDRKEPFHACDDQSP